MISKLLNSCCLKNGLNVLTQYLKTKCGIFQTNQRVKKIDFIQTYFEYGITVDGKIFDFSNNKFLKPVLRSGHYTVDLYIQKSKRKNFTIPFLVYYHHGTRKVHLPQRGNLIYWEYLDGDNTNFKLQNINPLIPINNIDDLFDYYNDICFAWTSQNNIPFYYLSSSELKNLPDKIYEQVSIKHSTSIKSPGTFVTTIVGRIIRSYNKKNKTNFPASILGLLKIKNVSPELWFSSYITNFNFKTESKVECFVLNYLFEIGFIGSDFRKIKLSEIIGSQVEINYIPDAFNLHSFEKKYVLEVFGFDKNGSDELSTEYQKKVQDKIKTYYEHGLELIFVHTHGKKYSEIFDEINGIFKTKNLILKNTTFSEKLFPKPNNINIKEELINLRTKIGFFTLTKLHDEYPLLYNHLHNYLKHTNISPTSWIVHNIFPETANIKSKNSWSVYLYTKEQKIINDVSTIKDLIHCTNDLYNLNKALYWRIYRFCKRNNTHISDFLIQKGIIKKKFVNRYELDNFINNND